MDRAPRAVSAELPGAMSIYVVSLAESGRLEMTRGSADRPEVKIAEG